MVDKKRALTFASRSLAVIAAVIGGLLGQLMVRRVLHARPEVASPQILNKTADRMNRNLPMMVDRETELSGTLGLEGVFVYNYRLVNLKAEEVPAVKLDQAMRPKIVTAACSTPETRDAFLKKGVTMRYNYSDLDGRFISSIEVALKDCKF